jgi:bifunctional DNA-binding transcriptional regulator/antitoxin component of YhaV-PrlF toxin-antitoxin module
MTIKTTQKVIKIGTSAGVTIPKKQLEEMSVSIGDEIELVIKPKNSNLRAFSDEFDGFMDAYSEDLNNLARR